MCQACTCGPRTPHPPRPTTRALPPAPAPAPMCPAACAYALAPCCSMLAVHCAHHALAPGRAHAPHTLHALPLVPCHPRPHLRPCALSHAPTRLRPAAPCSQSTVPTTPLRPAVPTWHVALARPTICRACDRPCVKPAPAAHAPCGLPCACDHYRPTIALRTSPFPRRCLTQPTSANHPCRVRMTSLFTTDRALNLAV